MKRNATKISHGGFLAGSAVIVGGGEDLNVRPEPATQYMPNEDRSVWDYLLSERMMFHDGEEFAYEYAIASAATKRMPSSLASVSFARTSTGWNP